MASRRIKAITAASALVLGAGGYFLYSVFAVQGQGTLAQAPLNDQVVIPPAFIMAVDDSGSMTFETLFPGNNGQGHWNTGTAATNGFYDAAGNLNTGGSGLWAHVMPNGINIQPSARLNIPPINNFGFARSPETNPSYFDPAVDYEPWRLADGTSFPDATTTAALSDPRDGASVPFDMTNIRLDSTTAGQFETRNGMVFPIGTQYYRAGATGCGGLGTTAATRNTWVTLTAAQTVSGTCRVGIGYFPATFYLRTTSPDPAGYLSGRVLATNACGAGCDMWRYQITAANFGAAYPDMIQNFANWYSYYGNRNRAMIAGMTLSLSDVQNMRVGFFTINNRVNPVAMRDMAVAGDKTALYTSLIGLPASGGTPNLFAVNHIGQQFLRTDANAPVQLSCQKNAGMLFTDGFSNSGSPGAPAVTGLGEPFDPTPANSLAAIATGSYLATLRTGPGFPGGQVPVPSGCRLPDGTINPAADPRLDCRADPHMNFYGITLGARGNIFDPDVPRDPFVMPYPDWVGHTDDSPDAIDDIWHATVNTRGEFINATTPAAITEAMRRVLASVSSGDTPSGSIALTGARIGNGSLTVVPAYAAINNGTDWYSTLTAATVTTDPVTRAVIFDEEWEASEDQDVVGGRNNIWFGGSAGAQAFTASNVGTPDNLCNNPRPGMSRCTGIEISILGGGTTLDEAIAYLKGDQSDEVTRGGDEKLRFRTTPLGDIVNSTPVVSAPGDDYGYRSLPAPYGGTVYSDYLQDKRDDRRAMVYAGANDGMLHAFDGRQGALGGGQERFAYIPQSVLGHMGNLLFPYDPADGGDQKYQHRYYVDGPVTVSDAYYGGDWATVLVGTTGAGARGVFALDVSDASATVGAFGASDRLWDISDLNTSLTTAVRDNIGHVLGRPVIVPVKTRDASNPVQWRAIFGNGYNSVSQKAVLFLVDIDTGSPRITMIEAVESGAPAGANGLGNLVAVDRFSGTTLNLRGRDGFADTVYAADQKGAVWKFDLRDTHLPSLPVVETPLFTTLEYTSGPEDGTRQPILGGLTAASGPGGGVLVYFGTGSFSFNNDPGDTTLQSLYAVLDNGSGITVGRSNLLEQTILGTVDGVRSTSQNTMIGGRLGWYLDLPAGERFVGYPRIESGILFMPTYAPDAGSGCDAVGNNWLYGLNALSGAAGLSNVRTGSPGGDPLGSSSTGAVALVGEGGTAITAPIKDVAVMTAPRVQPLVPGSLGDLDDTLAAQCSMVVQVAGAPTMYLPRPCGRQSWRQIQ